jgi:hypothetical protein
VVEQKVEVAKTTQPKKASDINVKLNQLKKQAIKSSKFTIK